MQFQWIGVSNRVEAEHKVDVGQEIAGGVHVEVLLQPPLGASVVDLAAAGEEEGDGVGRVGPRGGVEGGQQSSNLWSVDFFTKSKRQEETIIEICSNRERLNEIYLKKHGYSRSVAISASGKAEILAIVIQFTQKSDNCSYHQ